jgi:glutamate-1-semialdehyde 2,1-aminomutase
MRRQASLKGIELNMKTNTAPIWQMSQHRVLPRDVELFDRELRPFVPPGAFDAHAHLFSFAGLFPGRTPPTPEDAVVGLEAYFRETGAWMGDLCPADGLFFAMPLPSCDVEVENRFLADQVKQRAGSRALMLVRPKDGPARVERTVAEEGFVGFKVYHIYADRTDTFNAATEEFLTEWMWEIADRRGLCIMLHMVRPRALSDEGNQKYIREHCRKYPNARLILAHAARGFCARHTVNGIDSLRGLDNVFFDTSAICEAAAFEAIVRVMGVERLMFATDFNVSNFRGRCTSLGDSFFWMYENNVDWGDDPKGAAQPTLVGIESLLALQTACRQRALGDSDIERLFCSNARKLLGC